VWYNIRVFNVIKTTSFSNILIKGFEQLKYNKKSPKGDFCFVIILNF